LDSEGDLVSEDQIQVSHSEKMTYPQLGTLMTPRKTATLMKPPTDHAKEVALVM
jgi:hypothetical protein